LDPIYYWFIARFFTAGKDQKPYFHAGNYYFFGLQVAMSDIYIHGTWCFDPSNYWITLWLRRGISMCRNEISCKFCREAYWAIIAKLSNPPPLRVYNPSPIEGRQGTSIPLDRPKPAPRPLSSSKKSPCQQPPPMV